MLRRRDAARDEIRRDRGEIIVRRPLRAAPPRASACPFAAAADVGGHADAAAFEPELADRRVVIGLFGDAEAAVAGHVHEGVLRRLARPHLNIGNALAVDRDRLVTRDDETPASTSAARASATPAPPGRPVRGRPAATTAASPDLAAKPAPRRCSLRRTCRALRYRRRRFLAVRARWSASRRRRPA